MTPPELHIAFLKAADTGRVHDILDHASCREECYKCPAGPACDYLTDLSGADESFNDSFDTTLAPYLASHSHLTLADYERDFPEYFL